MQGITRQKTIDVCRSNGIPVQELDFSLTEVYGADEAFVTGTFPSQLHIREVDSREIGDLEQDTARSRAEIASEVE
ncbi:D-alanine aminotransferase [Penicillium taxi]|uniref:D-alanine aminotransferase n=1 Tax=Penicillium taxi TaxID=168475 RepID=UPI002545B617|nr:D-alanine aminotransferase [Penicillium taxi]KAJ5908464.1 D-alanine aminotransferase [Penicillium taxi]